MMKKLSALSIRQPYAEQVLRGTKDIEYRTMPTNKRERVYIYASKTPADDEDAWDEIGKQPGDLPAGVIVGTVEVVGCRRVLGEYQWDLAKPIRLKRPIKPKNHPQPAWFRPF
jgi:hypothetical protein